jgi:hypothetical protein
MFNAILLDAGGGTASSVASLFDSIDANEVLGAFFAVIPTVLSIAVPILAVKVGLRMLFSGIKGA